MARKYIVVNNGIYEEMITFGEHQKHSGVAATLFPNDTILSAGSIKVGLNGLECYGMSVSLGMKSRPEEDTKLARRDFG